MSNWTPTPEKTTLKNSILIRVTLTNTQLNKSKSAASNKIGTTLRITKKKFQVEELPHKLFLKTRQKSKIRNVFANNISIYIKFSKAHLLKIIHSGRFIGVSLGKLVGSLMKVGITLDKPFWHC